MNKLLLTCAVAGVISLTGCQNMNGNMGHHGMGSHHMMNQFKHENLTDAQIVKVLSTANNGEISQAQAAMPKLQNAQVRSYAQKMIDEHTMNEHQG